MNRSLTIILVSFLCLLLSGCPDLYGRAGKTGEESGSLSHANMPFQPGDVVSLKPDGVPAVIVGVADDSPKATYLVKYNSDGGWQTLKFLKIEELTYIVRYPITKSHTKTHALNEDEPTKTLHYETIKVNWYEIDKKKQDVSAAQVEAAK
jgi:hypothetical protein